jgi:hypothetical protein
LVRLALELAHDNFQARNEFIGLLKAEDSFKPLFQILSPGRSASSKQ